MPRWQDIEEKKFMIKEITGKEKEFMRKGFVPFITCGDPNLSVTEELIYALAKEEVSLIELGIPFSDPTAEGETIQKASERALKAGTTTDKIFEMVERIRKKTDIPLVFMTYANVVFSYGTERFIERSSRLGIYGIILPDVPFEEKEEFAPVCKKYGVKFISLIAPTSMDRIETIAREAEGFVYCVSSLGVTGVRNDFASNVEDVVKQIKMYTDIPVAVGFGVSKPEHVKAIHRYADSAIVGSAIVSICEKYGEKCVLEVVKYVKTMV